MKKTENRAKRIIAGLLVLGVLQLLMLGSLYAQVAPHPPSVVALFAIGPFLAASLSLIVVAIYLQGSAEAVCFAVASCLTALISFGPQKYFDAAFPHIWPAVILAQLAIITILYNVVKYHGKEISNG